MVDEDGDAVPYRAICDPELGSDLRLRPKPPPKGELDEDCALERADATA